MHNWKLPVVLLTWYNSLVLLGDGSVKSSITTVKPPGCGVASLNPGDMTAGSLGGENTILDEGLVEPLGWGNM